MEMEGRIIPAVLAKAALLRADGIQVLVLKQPSSLT
jgi:hypothetical protein